MRGWGGTVCPPWAHRPAAHAVSTEELLPMTRDGNRRTQARIDCGLARACELGWRKSRPGWRDAASIGPAVHLSFRQRYVIAAASTHFHAFQEAPADLSLDILSQMSLPPSRISASPAGPLPAYPNRALGRCISDTEKSLFPAFVSLFRLIPGF